MKNCSIEGCGKPHEARGWCDMHYARWKRTGAPLGLKIGERGNAVNPQGYKVYAGIREHVAIAETTLGKKLPRGVVVHHVDENRLNNNRDNLVICTRGYHMIIHARMRAREACGNPNWLRCQVCGAWDSPANLYKAPSGGTCYHKACRSEALKAGKEVPGCRLTHGTRLDIRA